MDTFETERLKAEQLTQQDLEKLIGFHEHPEIMEGLGGLKTKEQTQNWLNENLDHWKKYTFGIWILYEKESGKFIGRGGLRHVEIEGNDEIEIAYAFHPDYWGKGLATELSIALIDLAKKLGLRDVTSSAIPSNKASVRVMEKAGLVYEKDIVYKDELCVLYRRKFLY